MKKRTVWTRLLCMTLALAICLSIVPAALAAETTEGQVMVETEAGSMEPVDVTITIDSAPNPDGSTTTQTTTTANHFVTEKDLVVNYTGSSTTVTDSGGEILLTEADTKYVVSNQEGTRGAMGSSEISQDQIAPEVELDVPLTDTDDPNTEETENQDTQVSGRDPGTVVEITGDVKESEDDGEYDYTTSTVEKPGSATVTTTEITVTGSVDPESSDLDFISSDTVPDETNDLITELPSKAPDKYMPGSEAEPKPPEETVDGYEFIYEGTGNTSQMRPAVVFTEPLTPEGKVKMYGSGAYIHSESHTSYYVGCLTEEDRNSLAKNEDGSYVTDENGFLLDVDGNRVMKEELTATGPNGETYYLHRFDKLHDVHNVEGWYQDGEWASELNGSDRYGVVYATSQQFVLVNQETGEVATVYCADVETKTEKGFGYTMENLEDADYYSEEQAARIRSIALTGYWGSIGYETDAEGNTLLDEAGSPVPKAGSLEALKATLLASGEFTAEELESLTDGVAMTATQMAIWSCSNHMKGVQFVNTHYVGSESTTEVDKGGTNYMDDVPEAKENEAKLMFKLYEFLRNLEPTSYEEDKTTANTVINEQNFLKDMTLTVLEKAEGHANNQDADTTNDAYVTNLSFALVVTPSTENGDDLVVSVVDKNGNVIASGRIAGEAREGENVLIPDSEGNYSFTGITLTEGQQNFNITLEGIQNLEEGVYLYTSEIRTDESNEEVSSQTMVGVASGSHGVNVSMNIEFEVSVEDDIIVKERVWRDEWEIPDGDNPPPKQDPPKKDSDEPSEEPETVVRATPPKTGDSSLLYSILSALSGMGLSALQLLKKRKKTAAREDMQAAAQEEPPVPDAPDAQNTAQASAPTQEPAGEEVTAATASAPEAAQHSADAAAEENAKEVVPAHSPAGKTAANPGGVLTGKISGAGEREVMAARPIVPAENGAPGGHSPGIVSAPEAGASESGAIRNILSGDLRLPGEKNTVFPQHIPIRETKTGYAAMIPHMAAPSC